MEERLTFKFFRSFLDAALMLTDKSDRADFFVAVCQYALDGVEPDIEGVPAAMFALARPNIDASKKRSESGADGGSKTQAKRKQSESEVEGCLKQTASKHKAKRKQPSTEEGRRKKEVGRKDVGRNTPPTPPETEDRVQLAPLVSMTASEHKKLIERFGEADTKRLVDILDNYKGASGRKYESDYRAILSWCVDRLAEKKAKQGRGPAVPDLVDEAEASKRAAEDMERIRRLMREES